MRQSDQHLKVALCSGVFVEHDGISASLGGRLDLLQRLRADGAPVETTLYCRGSNIDDRDVRVVNGVASLLLEPGFLHADVVCFEFGIYYDLFDAIFALPDDTARIGVYHNITPLELVPPEHLEDMQRSIRQRSNLTRAHHIICISDYNRRDLLEIGISPDKTSTVPLPVPPRLATPQPPRAPRNADRPIGLLYVGRLVRAKGVLDLLDAALRLRDANAPDFRLTLVFNESFSDAALVGDLRRRMKRERLDQWLTLEPDASDARLAELYRQADCFVIPSYHEGFCVPVIEALTAGCPVIASDAGNLPFILDGLGVLFPAGNVDELTAALRRTLTHLADAAREGRMAVVDTMRGPLRHHVWVDAVEHHLRGFSRARFESGFLAAMSDALTATGRSVPGWLSEAQSTLRAT
jgi:glycosyltransferase involved in cell wall biosynthesis